MPSQKHPVQITRDEHDNDLYAKRISMVSAATIYVVGSPVISLATADIEIGAVEIKDASSDTRATVGADGLYVDVQNTINSIATIANFSSIGLATVDIRNTVDVSSTDLDIRDLDSSQDSVSAVQSGTWDIGTVTTLPNVTLAAGTSYIGFASISGNVNATQAGTWDIGTVSSIPNSSVTILNPTAIGLATVDINNTVTVQASDLDIRDLTSVSDSVSAVQSGTWNINAVSSLPEINALATVTQSGTVTVDGTVNAAQSGTWDIGTLTGITNDVNIADGGNSITVDGTVAVSSVPNSSVTVLNASAIGLATVTLNTGTAWIGQATIEGPVEINPLSFYKQASLVSGYVWYGFTEPGSNPTTTTFKIQRETLNTGEVLFASGTAGFIHAWSAASLASISYS